MAKVERESINFKLPKPLVEALRATAKERNTTATDLVIQGLRYVLGEVNGMETDVETRLHQLEAELNRLTSGIESSVENQLGQHSHRLSSLEQKLEAMATKLAQLEGALNAGQRYKSPARRQGYAYNSQVPQSLELQPFLAENLAKRLGVDTATLAREQKNKSQFEFESWSRNRDPSSTAWRYQDDGALPSHQVNSNRKRISGLTAIAPSSSKTGARQTYVTTVLLKITLITNTTSLQ